MIESTTLNKSNTLLPGEDFFSLRRQGIKSIEKLSSEIWTDYNNSDPGITILEAVSYAITDLSYRTGFDIKDLITPEQLTPDTWKNIFYTARQILHNHPVTINDYRKLLIDIKGVRNAWIEPSKDYEVPIWVDYNYYDYQENHQNGCACSNCLQSSCYGRLSNKAGSLQEYESRNELALEYIEKKVTSHDDLLSKYESEIIELNEQLSLALDSTAIEEIRTILKLRLEELGKMIQDLNLLKKDFEFIISGYLPSKIVEIEGLYNVTIEYEEDIHHEDSREEIRQHISEVLWDNRALCEDVLSINSVEYDDFGMGGSFVLEESADPDEVLAQIFFTIYKYFSPSIPHFTIPQLIAQGMQMDEIFEGPALQHGFIRDEDLNYTDLYRDIRLSDLINEIVDIQGLKAITYFHLPFNNDLGSKDFFNKWVNFLREEKKIARINTSISSIFMCKEREIYSYNFGRKYDRHPRRMLKLFKDYKSQERKYGLQGHKVDFDVPIGSNMELEDYYPITYSLPSCYGVNNKDGLPYDANDQRINQAHQLSAYLLFYEQMLANHLVQLKNLGNLFSFDDSIDRTYFTKALSEIENIKELVLPNCLPEFTEILNQITESVDQFSKRRNKFLNHMLARFGEDLNDYEEICRLLFPIDIDQRLIKDKIGILKDQEYVQVSSARGKGLNYTNSEFWNTLNVSGSERRIGRLLGFEDVSRRSLFPDFLTMESVILINEKTKEQKPKLDHKNKPLNVIKLLDPDNYTKVFLTSVEVRDGCCSEMLLQEIMTYADSKLHYIFRDELRPRRRKAVKKKGLFWFELYDGTNPDESILLASSAMFDTELERKNAFEKVQATLIKINANEGMHTLEHILLRPKIEAIYDENQEVVNTEFLKICLDECDLGIGLDEDTETPVIGKKITRVPAEKCYDKMPWILEYIKDDDISGNSILFQDTYPDKTLTRPLKFRRYENMVNRISDLQEYGSEHVNYKILSNQEYVTEPAKYSFIIERDGGNILAQSAYVFNKKTKQQEEEGIGIDNDIEDVIECLMKDFGFEFDLYCEPNPCDNNEDPYSFRTTVILPCWPKRFRNLTFRNLVEKTIRSESPAHIQTNIYWLGFSQMKEFEKVYCDWLEEMSQTEVPRHEKVNPLVKFLNELCECDTCDDECKS